MCVYMFSTDSKRAGATLMKFLCNVKFVTLCDWAKLRTGSIASYEYKLCLIFCVEIIDVSIIWFI